MKFKNIRTTLALVALAVTAISCATAPEAYQTTDHTALVIQTSDGQTGQMIQPTASAKEGNDQVLAEAAALPQHQTAVIILENFNEEKLGDEFRDRSTPWIVGLRNLGYEHIIFLQGLGIASPDGLATLVEYN